MLHCGLHIDGIDVNPCQAGCETAVTGGLNQQKRGSDLCFSLFSCLITKKGSSDIYILQPKDVSN